MQTKDILKKKGQITLVISVTIILDIIPVFLIMFGIWLIKNCSKFFGFEETAFVELLTTCSEAFMIILYLFFISYSLIQTYRLYMSEDS